MSSPESSADAGLPPLREIPLPPPASRWGLGKVLGATALLWVIQSLLMVLVTVAFMVSSDGERPDLAILSSTYYYLAELGVSLPIVYALSWRFAEGCRPGQGWRFLGFRSVALRPVLLGCGAIMVFAFVADQVIDHLNQGDMPDAMTEMYRNSESIWALFALLVIGAPLLEEVFFRGFLLEALRYTRIGAIGAIVLSSFAWAALHLQYNLIGISIIFLMGLLLGWTRLRTGSIYPTLVMHGLNNLMASIQLYLVAGHIG